MTKNSNRNLKNLNPVLLYLSYLGVFCATSVLASSEDLLTGAVEDVKANFGTSSGLTSMQPKLNETASNNSESSQPLAIDEENHDNNS